MRQLQQDYLDLDSFFHRGYAVGQLNEQAAAALAMRVQRESYIRRDEDQHDPGAASWEATGSDLPHDNAVPPVDRRFFDRLRDEPYFHAYQSRFGSFSRDVIMLQLARQYDEMGWHWDGCDSTHMVNMVYLTPDSIGEGDGGLLEIGTCLIDRHGQPRPQDGVEVIGRVVPRNGTVVTLNNLSPGFVHRVTPLASDKQRYTLIGQFGYAENVDPVRTQGWVGTRSW